MYVGVLNLTELNLQDKFQLILFILRLLLSFETVFCIEFYENYETTIDF